MGEQLNVDPAVLQQAADGITGVISELSDLGIGETGAMGRGFSLLTLSPMEAGKASVQSAFETFTERWSWGVRSLVQAGNEIAKTLGLAAGRYHIMDEKFSNTFKEMFTQLTGNPHLSKEEIDARSWGDTLADNQFNQVRHTDYSAESFQNAFTHIGTNIKVIEAVGPDALGNNGPIPGIPRHWNTGAAERASEIMNGQGGGE
ncbi:type VII secretion target [Nocardia sp. CA-084685]|uniref:type VII secretion target n=1 Tax=Nocardia sp. CA-084685 TaxID=3239970 RepID=UPI003D9553BF